MKKTYIALLLVVAFICTYTHGLTSSVVLAGFGVASMLISAVAALFAKK